MAYEVPVVVEVIKVRVVRRQLEVEDPVVTQVVERTLQGIIAGWVCVRV